MRWYFAHHRFLVFPGIGVGSAFLLALTKWGALHRAGRNGGTVAGSWQRLRPWQHGPVPALRPAPQQVCLLRKAPQTQQPQPLGGCESLAGSRQGTWHGGTPVSDERFSVAGWEGAAWKTQQV